MRINVYKYKRIYKNQDTRSIHHSPLTSDLGQICNVKVFVRGIFQGSYYCSILKFVRKFICISVIGIYKNQGVMIHTSWFTDL